jgi:hypothetical protein
MMILLLALIQHYGNVVGLWMIQYEAKSTGILLGRFHDENSGWSIMVAAR